MAAYLINLIYDQETDRRNNKGHYLTRGIFRVRTVILMAFVYFAVASVAFQLSVAGQRPWILATLVLALVYSLPPLRLCARPLLDLAANAFFYGGIAFLLGFAGRPVSAAEGLASTIPYVLLVGANFLHTTILDVDGDRATDKRTTSVAVGVRVSAGMAVALAAAALVAAIEGFSRRGDLFTLVIVALSFPAFVVGASKLRGADETVRSKVSSNVVQYVTAVVAVAACVFKPMFAAVIVPLVVVSRLYYRARFGLNYPGPAQGDAGGTD